MNVNINSEFEKNLKGEKLLEINLNLKNMKYQDFME